MMTKMKFKILFTIIFSYFSIATFAADKISDLNTRIKNIDRDIQKKSERIKNINTETNKLEKMIKELEIEILKTEKERAEIEKEIEIVQINIDYGKKNLEISEGEHSKKLSEYTAKIIAWDKYLKIHKNLSDKSILKKNYREMLHGDLERMEYIEKITGNIKEVKAEIEKENAKLVALKNKLKDNILKSDKKKAEHKDLISKLGKEKKTHESSIASLKKEKLRISREIERIIRENAKSKSTPKKTVNISNSEAYKKIGKTLIPVNGEIVVYFGQKKSGVVESNGIEIKSKVGAAVKASKNGKVIYSDKFQGLGKVVMIDYGNEIIGVYGNLIATKVSRGSTVKQGQVIGSLGLSSEKLPNLYYELRVNLKPIDPVPTF